MRPVDVGIDAARILCARGPGRVRAVFGRALYLQVPGGLVVLVTTQEPRGPLHVRVASLPAVVAGCPVRVDLDSFWIGDHGFRLDAPIWSPRLPPAASLVRVRGQARRWLPEAGPALDVGSTRHAPLHADAVTALRRGDLRSFAATVGGRGPGLTPVGDDMLAGVLLVACAMWSGWGTTSWARGQGRHLARTNDIARAFLVCAARGRCIEPVHSLLTGLASGDQLAVSSALEDLRRFGSSSGAALVLGVRAALLELPAMSVARPEA
jgi:hypothetical protein